jgi:predicted metal-dependent hydrolase
VAAHAPRRPPRPDHERRKQKALTLAVGQFNHALYFECHETLEEIWLEESGPDALFLQGIIQAAAALHNLHRGRFEGPARLLNAAREKLLPYGPSHLGVDLRSFCELLQELHGEARARDRDRARANWNPHPAPRILYREPPFEY